MENLASSAIQVKQPRARSVFKRILCNERFWQFIVVIRKTIKRLFRWMIDAHDAGVYNTPMILNKLRHGLFATALVLAVSAQAQETYALKSTPKVGEKVAYKVTIETTIQGVNALFTGKSVTRVVKVEPNGNVSSVTEESDLKVKIEDQVVDLPAEDPHGVTTDQRGILVTMIGKKTRPDDYRLAYMNCIVAPDAPVKVGDSWSYEFKPNPNHKNNLSKAEYTLAAIEKVKGISCAKIKVNHSESGGGEKPLSLSGNVWIRLTDGMPMKADTVAKNVPLIEGTDPADMTIKFEVE